MRLSSHTNVEPEAIEDLVRLTFTASEGPDEGRLIGSLARSLIDTTAADDIFGFLAYADDDIVGAVIATRLTFPQRLEAFIVAPVAVHPDYQGRGFGQALLRHGIAELRQAGIELLMTYGDPAYYHKVGFQAVAPEQIQPPYELSQPLGWIGQMLNGEELLTVHGRCVCVEALSDPRYW